MASSTAASIQDGILTLDLTKEAGDGGGGGGEVVPDDAAAGAEKTPAEIIAALQHLARLEMARQSGINIELVQMYMTRALQVAVHQKHLDHMDFGLHDEYVDCVIQEAKDDGNLNLRIHTLVLKAGTLDMRGRTKDAVRVLQEALALDPTRTDVRQQLQAAKKLAKRAQ